MTTVCHACTREGKDIDRCPERDLGACRLYFATSEANHYPCNGEAAPLQSRTVEGTIQMSIKPSAPVEKPSPLMGLCASIKLFAENRALLYSMHPDDDRWRQMLDDLAMLCGGAPMGIKTQWVRRVAAPVWFAGQKMFSGDAGRDRAAMVTDCKAALDLLKQCSDVPIQTVCSGWIRGTYNVQ